jgi:thioredoxin 1
MNSINNIDEWNVALENDKILINFGAKWCNPCKKLKPELEKISLEKKYENFKFYKIDIDDFDEISSKLNITSIPTTIIIKNKKITNRITGINLNEIIENMI